LQNMSSLFFSLTQSFGIQVLLPAAATSASVGWTNGPSLGVDCRAEDPGVADAYAAVTESVGCPDAHGEPADTGVAGSRHALRYSWIAPSIPQPVFPARSMSPAVRPVQFRAVAVLLVKVGLPAIQVSTTCSSRPAGPDWRWPVAMRPTSRRARNSAGLALACAPPH
jgi:hypothetical protein